MDTAAPTATQYSGLRSLMTFLMISMLPIHLRPSAACHAFRGVVLHAGPERGWPKFRSCRNDHVRVRLPGPGSGKPDRPAAWVLRHAPGLAANLGSSRFVKAPTLPSPQDHGDRVTQNVSDRWLLRWF